MSDWVQHAVVLLVVGLAVAFLARRRRRQKTRSSRVPASRLKRR